MSQAVLVKQIVIISEGECDTKMFSIMKQIVTVQFSGLSVKCLNYTADWIPYSHSDAGWLIMNGSIAGWMRFGGSAALQTSRVWNVYRRCAAFLWTMIIWPWVTSLSPGLAGVVSHTITLELKLVAFSRLTSSVFFAVEAGMTESYQRKHGTNTSFPLMLNKIQMCI